jgi:hypothetical protein
VLADMVEHHADSTFTKLGGVIGRSWHGALLSRNEPSDNPVRYRPGRSGSITNCPELSACPMPAAARVSVNYEGMIGACPRRLNWRPLIGGRGVLSATKRARGANRDAEACRISDVLDCGNDG